MLCFVLINSCSCFVFCCLLLLLLLRCSFFFGGGGAGGITFYVFGSKTRIFCFFFTGDNWQKNTMQVFTLTDDRSQPHYFLAKNTRVFSFFTLFPSEKHMLCLFCFFVFFPFTGDNGQNDKIKPDAGKGSSGRQTHNSL